MRGFVVRASQFCAVLAVDDDRNERLAVDEVVDARALLLIGFDLEERAACDDFGVARIDDARAVAAVLRFAPCRSRRASRDMTTMFDKRMATLRSLLPET